MYLVGFHKTVMENDPQQLQELILRRLGYIIFAL